MAYWINGVKKTDYLQFIAESGALNKYYITGTSLVKLLTIPEDVTAVLGDFHHWTGLTEVVIANTEIVVTGLDTKFGSGVVFWVPDNMLSAYETEYPTLSFESWANFKVWTIPFDGTTTTLTADYIAAKIAEDPRALGAEKVIIVGNFTAMGSLCLDALETMQNDLTVEIQNGGNWKFSDIYSAAGTKIKSVIDASVSGAFNGCENALDSIIATNLTVLPYSYLFRRGISTKIRFFEGREVISVGQYSLQESNVETISLPSYVNDNSDYGFWDTRTLYVYVPKLTSLRSHASWAITAQTAYTKVFLGTPNCTTTWAGTYSNGGEKIRFYVPAEYMDNYTSGANGGNWLNWLCYNSRLCGFLDYTDTVPTLTNFSLNWYSDEDCTASVLPENFVAGNRYFCKPYLPAEFTIPYNGNQTLTDAYVQALANLPGASSVTKIIVPSDYANTTILKTLDLSSLFPNLEELDFYYKNPSASASNTDYVNFASIPLSYGIKKLTVRCPSNYANVFCSGNSEIEEITVYATATYDQSNGFAVREAFANNQNLKKLVFANGFTVIYAYSPLYRLPNLEYFEFPETATPLTYALGIVDGFSYIGNSTTNGTTLWLKANGVAHSSKTDNSKFDKIYVPASVIVDYTTDSVWSTHASKMVGYLDYTDTIPTFSGYTDQWYEDEDCTTPIATSAFVSGTRYFVKLTANA